MTVSDQAWGGKHQYMDDLAEGLRERGHHVSVVCERGSRMHEHHRTTQRPHHAVAAFAAAPQTALADLGALIDQEGAPDVLIVSGRHDAEVAHRLLEQRLPDRKLSTQCQARPAVCLFRHSAFPLSEGTRTEELLRSTDLIVATSREQAERQFEHHVEAGTLRPRQVHVMLSSVPPALEQRLSEVDREAAREALQVDPEAFVFLVPARLSWEKGIDRALSAFAALPEGVRELAVLIVAGEGPDEQALRAQCAAAGLEQQVIFAGHQEDMAPLYTAADVVVLASTVPETGPLALKEAMAAGLPVIASRLGGIPEFVKHEEHGFLVDSTEELVAAMERMVRDEALAGSMGIRARNDVLHKHMLAPRLDHFETQLLALHLSTGVRAEALSELNWAEVRLKDEGDRGMVFVPANSLITVVDAEEMLVIEHAVRHGSSAALDDPRVGTDTLVRLVQMAALVPLRLGQQNSGAPR
ncbi:glycosyltransferase family 4 protein [Kineococcus sp. SYSU DK005]|uniref:glycosyltransferase family 4 protein n=1 Tax=Kineococcus sp. SYSU DK005 TaxID=3383126 RepID=UPI003D7D1006